MRRYATRTFLALLGWLVVAAPALAAAPSVVTDPVSSVTSTAVTLAGTVSPNGAATTAWFRLFTADPGSCTDTAGTRVPGSGGVNVAATASSQPFQLQFAGLVAGQTYFFCALASNADGTELGAVRSFTTQATPSFLAFSVEVLSSTSARVDTKVNANGSQTRLWYRLSTTSAPACHDAFGDTVSPWPFWGSGVFSDYEYLKDLTPGTTYFLCAFAENDVGLSASPMVSFTVPGPPIVTTSSATVMEGRMAALNATVNPRGFGTVAWFRMGTEAPARCDDTYGTRIPQEHGVFVDPGETPVGVSMLVKDLAPGRTYHFCALAQSAIGVSTGNVISFTSLIDPPGITTSAATWVDARSAVLHGMGVARWSEARAWFRFSATQPTECSDTFGKRVPSEGGIPLGAALDVVAFSHDLSALTPNQQYWFCAIGSNEGGASFGALQSFRTAVEKPRVRTGIAEADGEGYVIRGIAEPYGMAARAWFQLATVPGACAEGYGERVPADPIEIASTQGTVLFEHRLSDGSNRKYWQCAVVETDAGITYGDVRSFEWSSASGGGCTATGSGVSAGWLLAVGALALRRRAPPHRGQK